MFLMHFKGVGGWVRLTEGQNKRFDYVRIFFFIFFYFNYFFMDFFLKLFGDSWPSFFFFFKWKRCEDLQISSLGS